MGVSSTIVLLPPISTVFALLRALSAFALITLRAFAPSAPLPLPPAGNDESRST